MNAGYIPGPVIFPGNGEISFNDRPLTRVIGWAPKQRPTKEGHRAAELSA